MSFIRIALEQCRSARRVGLQKVTLVRDISQSCISHQELQEAVKDNSFEFRKEHLIKPSSDRSFRIPVEISIKYLQSDAYKHTYGDKPVWLMYRRNFKGHFQPKKTRKTCIRNQVITTTNACPICRDEYLVLDYRNILLIKQFISPINGQLYGYEKTGLCQMQHKQLLCAIYNAKNYGTISFDPPFIKYDYTEWYKPDVKCTHDH
ncbi:PREDICTED: 28S ribosomal protein S18b, mitochondrial [Ceratosolen solmsi marchali]|uniref:Small ribosomal subunit protein mS40 n=1 Tax=Ceratosolen solmsi marchali TaxID=326594 RepID=A0AAJ7E391_9HYME|nr:PREDICTED: 28S ribosomal protein S18b, mitochondrial [Ceratosolen solmsi marchali]